MKFILFSLLFLVIITFSACKKTTNSSIYIDSDLYFIINDSNDVSVFDTTFYNVTPERFSFHYIFNGQEFSNYGSTKLDNPQFKFIETGNTGINHHLASNTKYLLGYISPAISDSVVRSNVSIVKSNVPIVLKYNSRVIDTLIVGFSCSENNYNHGWFKLDSVVVNNLSQSADSPIELLFTP